MEVVTTMTKVILLEELKTFTKAVTRDALLPVRPLEEDLVPPEPRPPHVYQMRLPAFRDAYRKAPYILHQAITGKDTQAAGARPEALAVIRTIFCVYHENEEEGALALLNLMETMRVALLERPVLPGPFALDLKAGLETLAYPDDTEPRTAPYYLGEMISTWNMPPVGRLGVGRVIHGAPPWDPKAMHLQETTDLKERPLF